MYQRGPGSTGKPSVIPHPHARDAEPKNRPLLSSNPAVMRFEGHQSAVPLREENDQGENRFEMEITSQSLQVTHLENVKRSRGPSYRRTR